jgi:hypothetical protein
MNTVLLKGRAVSCLELTKFDGGKTACNLLLVDEPVAEK